MRANLVFLGLTGTFLFLSSLLLAQEMMIPAVKDNTIYSESDSSNGKGNYVFTGITSVGNERRALLKFDLSMVHPDDSILSVSFRLYLSKTTSGDYSVGLYKLKRDWGEGASAAKFEEGGGATPQSGDATWHHAFFDTAAWKVTGGDHEEKASAVNVVGGGIGYYIWTGDTLLADVREWIQNPDSNFGWMMIVREQETPTAKRFNSRENAEFPPQLVVNVAQPTGTGQSKETEFSIFPNPSSGLVYIRRWDLDKISMRLIDLSGREIPGKYYQITRISPSLISVTVQLKGTFFLQVNQSHHKIIIL